MFSTAYRVPTLVVGAAIALTGVAPLASAAPIPSTTPSAAVQPTTVEQLPLSSVAVVAAVVPAPPAGPVQVPQAQTAGTVVRELTRGTTFSMAAITWKTATPTDMQVRGKEDNGAWGPWHLLAPIDSARDGVAASNGTDPVFLGHTHTLQVAAAAADPSQVSLVVLAPDEQPTSAAVARSAQYGSAALSGPFIISRAAWGADERLHCSTPEYSASVKAAVVHHTDGINNYSPEQSASIVRGIYVYHAQTLGWCDIGYNALVDRYGQIFEGAAGGLDRAVIGAHAGGFNTNTVGVAMMGDHTSVPPTEPELDALARYLAWQFKLWGLDPHGGTQLTSGGGIYTGYPAGTVVSVPQLMGHRDVDLTACPGNVGYAYLANIRDRVAGYLASADLAVTVNIPSFLPAGQNIPISVRVANNGLASAPPSDTTFLSLGIGTITDGAGAGGCGGCAAFHTPTLAAGQSVVYDLHLQTVSGSGIGGTFVFTVPGGPDPNLGNNWGVTLHSTW